MADMAHFAGLAASSVRTRDLNPVPHAEIRDQRGRQEMTEDLPEPPAQPGLTPDLILLATSFMATRYLIWHG